MDLFGDIEDISSESDEDTQPRAPGQSADEHGGSRDRDPQAEEPTSETRIKIEIPSVSYDLGNELYFVKLPKFLNIESKPFDPQFYEDEFEDEKMLYEEDRTRLKLKVENTIRWRIRRDEEGKKIRESNARIVKWSDGSMSLHLGSEVFDVHRAPLQGNYNHLFIREDTGLLGQAIFKSRLTFRPHSTNSATHKKMTVPLMDRSSKTQKIRILPMVGHDPECQRTKMIKKAEQHLRVSTRKSSHRRGKKNQQRPCALHQDPGSDEEEGEEDEEASSLAATGNHQQGELRERTTTSSSDEGSEDKAQKAKKLTSDEEMTPLETGKPGVKRKMSEA